MARYSDTITTTEQQLREFAENLRKMAADFEAQADNMQELGLKSIDVTHWKSARDGVAGYAAFAAAIKKAIVFASQMTAVLGLLKDPTQQAATVAADAAALPEPQKPQPKGATRKRSKP